MQLSFFPFQFLTQLLYEKSFYPLLVVASLPVFAQAISGRVVGKDGGPVPGATMWSAAPATA
jgi:hypothetical protein